VSLTSEHAVTHWGALSVYSGTSWAGPDGGPPHSRNTDMPAAKRNTTKTSKARRRGESFATLSYLISSEMMAAYRGEHQVELPLPRQAPTRIGRLAVLGHRFGNHLAVLARERSPCSRT
jgi:hypothetical protein